MKLINIISILLLAVGCSGSNKNSSEKDVVAGLDSETTLNSSGDTTLDPGSDTTSGMSSDTTSGTGSDTDSNTGSDTSADSGTETSTETSIDTSIDTETQWDSETSIDTETTILSNCTDPYGLPECMKKMSEDGGGTIYLDSQTYYLTQKLTLKDNVNIVGQKGKTLITWDDSVKDVIDAPLLWASTVENVSLIGLTLQCHIDQDPDSSDLRNDHIGLYMYGSGDPTLDEPTSINNIYLQDLEVYYCSHGIHIKGATDVTAIDLNLHNNGNTEVDYFHNIYWRRVGNLIVKQTDENVGGYYASPRGHGIRGSHLKNVYFENLSVFDNADHGVHVDTVYNMRLNNMHIHDNCANPSGGCSEYHCYSDFCDINWDAPKEDL